MTGTSTQGADDRGGESKVRGEHGPAGSGVADDPVATDHPAGEEQAQENVDNEPAG